MEKKNASLITRPVIGAFLRIGLVSRNYDGSIHWPVYFASWHLWVHLFKHGPRAGFFRNLPGVIKWYEGRLLPRRWGFFLLGFEFGDRGSHYGTPRP